MHAPLPKLPAEMPVERSRSRRERRSASARLPVLHVVAPGLEVARETPRKGETVTAFLRRTGWAFRDPKYGWQFKKRLPTILEVNGEPVLRKDWRRTKIAANDNVRFVSFPRGGGKQGKQVLGLVALVAVAAFAAWAGPAAAAGLGLTGTAATITGGLITGAIGLGGALLVNALVAPKQGATNDGTPTDQIYTASAQGNRARLGQPLPVWYGRNKDYPDFAATPWGEFVGNDQYLNVLLSVTMGSMEYEQLTISDTPFWNPVDGVLPAFSSAQVEFYEPNEPVTLFPVNVTQSEEVSGQQLPVGTPGAWIGPFVANPSGTAAYQLAIDFVFPAGCFEVDDEGNTISRSVDMRAERRTVNDAGAPIGDWLPLAIATRTYASRSPIRDSFVVGVPEGRYEVRFRRENGVPADNKGAAEVVWAGLRAFLRGENAFPVSTIAIRIKASENTQGSFKFGVIGTRKLPVWDGEAFVTQATRNPTWALLDMATNAQYGAEVLSSKVDFNTIVNHASGCTARGDSFDYIFKSAVAVPEAFDTAIIPSRSRHMWLGDTLSLVRDEWSSVPAMMLTDREIVRDSTSFEYTMLGEEDPDAVILEYLDENTWLPASVQYPPNTEIFTATRPETKRVNGIINRSHAYRECAFYYLCSIYRREVVSIGCEYEGRAITMGANLRLQSELPENYGYAGAVTDRDSYTLTLDPAPVWAVGEQHYIRLRRPNGKEFGPVRASKGMTNAEAVLNSDDLAMVEGQQGITLANVLLRADGAEYPTYALGTADNQSKLVKVLTGQPNGETFTLSVVVDDERVHATDLGDPPVLPVSQFPANDRVPLIAGLTAQFDQGIAEPTLRASWFPAAGAFYYRAEASYDDGNSWIEIYQGQDNRLEKVVTLGALSLRVQAIGAFPGPFSSVSLEAPTIEIATNTVAYNSLKEAVQAQVTTIIDEQFASDRRRIAELATAVQQVLGRSSIDKKMLRSTIVAASDRASASIDEVRTVAVDTQGAVAVLEETVGAEFDGVKATVVQNSTAIATLEGYAASQWSVLTDVGGNVAGLVLFNEGATLTSFDVIVDAFRVAFPGVAGGTAVPVFTIGNVDGVAKCALRGDMLIDGSVITQMIAAGAITSVTIQAGAINTTQLAINSVDINNIIANAVTKTDFSFFAGGFNGGSITRSVEIKSGLATVTVCGEFSSSIEPTPTTSSVIFYVDGSTHRIFNFAWYQYGGGYRLVQPFTVQHTITGLSSGVHSIGVYAGIYAYNVEVYITDFRR